MLKSVLLIPDVGRERQEAPHHVHAIIKLPSQVFQTDRQPESSETKAEKTPVTGVCTIQSEGSSSGLKAGPLLGSSANH